MKRNKHNIILGIIIVVIAILLIGLSLKQNANDGFEYSSEQVHSMLVNEDFEFDPQKLNELIEKGGNEFVLVDLRSPERFEQYHIPNAINIPFQRVLDESNLAKLENDGPKIFYASRSKAAEITVMLTQMGYKDIYTLKGGLEYWQAKVENKDVFGNVALEDEKAKYDFKKELEGEE